MLVNSVANVVKHATIMLADDMKIIHKLRSTDDCHELQSDLNSIYTWACRLGLQFNVKKCEQISYSHKKKE